MLYWGCYKWCVSLTPQVSYQSNTIDYHQYSRPWCVHQRKRIECLPCCWIITVLLFLAIHSLYFFRSAVLFCHVFPSQNSYCWITHVIFHHGNPLTNVLMYNTWFLCCCSERQNTCVYCCRIGLVLDLKIDISFEIQQQCRLQLSSGEEEHVVCILSLNMALWRFTVMSRLF